MFLCACCLGFLVGSLLRIVALEFPSLRDSCVVWLLNWLCCFVLIVLVYSLFYCCFSFV